MRWTPLLFALAISGGCTCGAKKQAPDSVALSEALRSADVAVGVAAVPEQKTACERVATELSSWASAAQLFESAAPLVAEVHELADEGLRLSTTKEDWAELRARIDAFVKTGQAAKGPRFRRDLPKDVREAVELAEHSFESGDQLGGCSGADKATMALSDFAWREPPPLHVEKIKDALERLDAMPDSCRTVALADARARFADAVKPLER